MLTIVIGIVTKKKPEKREKLPFKTNSESIKTP